MTRTQKKKAALNQMLLNLITGAFIGLALGAALFSGWLL